ncbi:MAG TPA: lyase family protein [Nocardioidaceae bacterium]|nr:lyase family protein [Nocardioidaceae bacterium]
MSGLLWPGQDRVDDLLSDVTVMRAMVRVEQVWLTCLVETRIAPPSAIADLDALVGNGDVTALAHESEASGNPVVPLVMLLRERLRAGNPEAAQWLHRGLTSQDVLDTALMIGVRDIVVRLRVETARQLRLLCGLAAHHRASPMAARTLTQHAVPTTFGVKAAQWATGLVDAAEDLAAVRFCAQAGGAAGTLSAVVQLAAAAEVEDPTLAALELVALVSDRLDLDERHLWHTARAPVTRVGDALVRCTDGYGRIANDILTLSRPEIGELSEGRGGQSSTMPQKRNPVLSVLIRRAAIGAPQLGATLHLAAAEAVDERPDGSWHVEWETLRTLAQHVVVAARQTTELLTHLVVDEERMRANHDSAWPDLTAEQRTMSHLVATVPQGDYRGAGPMLVDLVCGRAAPHLQEHV